MKSGEIWVDKCSDDLEVKILFIKDDIVYYKFLFLDGEDFQDIFESWFGKDYINELPRKIFISEFRKKR